MSTTQAGPRLVQSTPEAAWLAGPWEKEAVSHCGQLSWGVTHHTCPQQCPTKREAWEKEGDGEREAGRKSWTRRSGSQPLSPRLFSSLQIFSCINKRPHFPILQSLILFQVVTWQQRILSNTVCVQAASQHGKRGIALSPKEPLYHLQELSLQP